MNGYADLFFTHVADYINLLFENEFIMYFSSFYVVLCVVGLFRRLLKVNRNSLN